MFVNKTLNYNYKEKCFVSQYRQMKLLVFYDLPTTSKVAIAEHTKFRNNLIKLGYVRMQESVYLKHFFNHIEMNKGMLKLERILPSKGDIRILPITNKQYESKMVVIRGNRSLNELNQNDNDLIVL